MTKQRDDLTAAMTDAERESMIAYLIGTQALAGITVTRTQAEWAVEEAYRLPLVDLDTPAERDEE